MRRTISSLFDDQVARTPEAIALESGEQELSYSQLDERANRLARRLQSMDVGPDTLVGVFMDRSPDMMIALVAILKAGGAYVPLDPAHPGERVSFMIEDSRANVVLTNEHLRQRLPAVTKRILSLDGEANELARQDPSPVLCRTTGANLAYVIYTSGSTGKPKGVMVEHRNVVSFFSAMDRLLGTKPGVWLAVTSISFDISVLELLWTLTRGHKVVLHGEEGTHTIAGEIIRHGVTHFQSTPSLARMLASDPRFLAAVGSVQNLLLGGEALPASLIGVLRAATSAQIYNMYGPTETTIWSTVYGIPDAAIFGSTIPVGRPLSNTRAYVLDADLRAVSNGEPGELFLGGEGVARGYWERPELTNERFLPDPFANGDRMYRTGDLARLLPDGNLEFLGRTDFQVKLRGYRIELGEIEAILEQYPKVRQAVVVAREDRPGDKRLVAYLVPNGGESLIASDLRAALESKLPEYMVPSHFVILDRLPLTPNGKIDRNSLPTPVSRSQSGAHSGAFVADSRNENERIIAKVWAEALDVEQVGLDENIFDLGATSLMMPEVQIELQRNLDCEITLVDLFEFHTVRSLAAHLAGTSVVQVDSTRAERRRAARQRIGRP
jgi:amino acid adenylation domain-containing protein